MLTTTDELAEWQLAMATAVLAMLPPVAVVGVHAAAVRARTHRDGKMRKTMANSEWRIASRTSSMLFDLGFPYSLLASPYSLFAPGNPHG